MHRWIAWIASCCILLFAACGDNKPGVPPTLFDRTVTTAEDTPVTVEVSVKAIALGALVLSVATPPSHGALTGNGALTGYGPSWTYTPAANFNGRDTIVVHAEDRFGGSSATVTLVVTPVDDAPVAVADAVTTAEDTTATIGDAMLLANDTDVDNQALQISAVGNASHGSVTHTGTQVWFVPDASFHGTAGFDYTVTDGLLTDVGSVVVTVTAIDDPPVAVADSATVTEGSSDTTIDVLSNDSDIDGGPRSVASITHPAHGTAAIGLLGLSITYTPAAGYCNQAPNAALDTFTYTLAPGASSATVSVAVTCACGELKPTDFVVGSN